MKTMKLVFLLFFFPVTLSVIHSMTILITVSSGIKNIPDVMTVAVVDEVPIGHCDSIGKKAEATQDWAKKFVEDDPQHLEWYTEKCQLVLKYAKELTDVFKGLGGVQILQNMEGCEWDDETGETDGVAQFGFNGEDFMAFDPKTLTWIAQSPIAVIYKSKFVNDDYKDQRYKSIITHLYPAYMNYYLDYRKNFLLRKDLPSVSLLQKTPSSPVICFATGFYFDRADIFWRKDGEELHEDVELGEILPNHDGSFQMSVDLNLSSVTPEDWRRYECVFHLSGVKDDIITKLDKAVIRTNWVPVPPSEFPAGPVIGGVVGLMLLAVCITGVFIWRRRNNGVTTSGDK